MYGKKSIGWTLLTVSCILSCAGCASRSKGERLAGNLLRGSELESLSPLILFSDFNSFGSMATAEGTVTTGFRFQRENNRWVLKEVRLGELGWESVQDLKEALDNIRARHTRQDMQSILDAIEKYNVQEGVPPSASDFVDLIDKLSPKYLNRVIRVDGWHHEYRMRISNGKPTIISNGPDGKEDTPDDIR
ncbi:MAG: type II secretion system protein GspG [Acidobacteria bacterium]|nr:type II secretion system protein GspG [Acidobacteriota bacterium]